MNYLLDTHTLIWSIFESYKLPVKVQEIIRDPNHNILVSTVSFWEISLKYRLGKLDLGDYKPTDLPDICNQMQYQMVPLRPEEASSYHELSSEFHKDPFDRMLIHQCIKHQYVLLSKDARVHQYAIEGLRVLWA